MPLYSDPLIIFTILLLIILFAPFLMKRINLPPVVGIILIGMLLGPYMLHVIPRSETAKLFGKIGIICIMFLAGLELDLNRLARQRGETLVFGLLTFTIPLAAGIFGAVFFFNMPLMPAVLLASMFSSHTLLTYPTIGKYSLAKNRAVTATVGGTAITNFLAMVILAVCAGLAHGEDNLFFWIRMSALMVGYTIAVFTVLPWLADKALKRLSSSDELQFLMIFTLVFAVSSLGVLAGVEPVIGAFFAGLALNRLVPESSLLMNRLQFIGNTLFIPLFLADVGLIIDPNALLKNPAAWLFGIFMVVTALITKYLPSLFTSLIFKYTKGEQGLSFGLSVNQAAATLAAVLVGREIGLFDDIVVAATILMILVTCVAGSVITENAAVRTMKERDALPAEGAKITETPRIMVTLSNPESAPHLIDLATMLVSKGHTEVVYPTVVVRDGPDAERDLVHAEAVLAKSVARLITLGIRAIPVTGLDENIADGMLRVSKARRAQVVILGWNGRFGVDRALFGSVLDQFVHNGYQRMVVAKLTAKGLHGRLIIILPPMIERMSDLAGSFAMALHFAENTGSQICAIMTGREDSIVAKRLEQMRRTIPLSVRMIETWHKIESALGQEVRANDVIMLFSSRKHQPAWQPSLERLPRKLTGLFPSNDLIFVYPADAGRVDFSDNREHASLQPGPIQNYRQEDGETLDDSLMRVLVSQISREGAERGLAEMTKLGTILDIELRPGVFLLHMHTAELNDFFISLIRFYDPAQQKGAGGTQLLIVLLSPVDRHPDEHLEMLSRIAKWVAGAEFYQGLEG